MNPADEISGPFGTGVPFRRFRREQHPEGPLKRREPKYALIGTGARARTDAQAPRRDRWTTKWTGWATEHEIYIPNRERSSGAAVEAHRASDRSEIPGPGDTAAR